MCYWHLLTGLLAVLCGCGSGKWCAILSNNGPLLILIDPYYLCNIDNKTQFKFDTLLGLYWPIAGTRVSRRALIGRQLCSGGERERASSDTLQHVQTLFQQSNTMSLIGIIFCCSDKTNQHKTLFLFCFVLSCQIRSLRGQQSPIKRQIKFWNEKSDASQSVGVRHLLIGLWHFWFVYDLATRLWHAKIITIREKFYFLGSKYFDEVPKRVSELFGAVCVLISIVVWRELRRL